MELTKERYKKSDFGLIPEAWSLPTLKEICVFRRGSFPQPYGLPKWYDDVHGMPFVQVFDVADNRMLKPITKQRISQLAQPMSVFVPKGTIILTIQGSIGRIALTQYDSFIDRTLLIFNKYLKEIDKHFFMYIVERLFEIEKQRAWGGTIKTITKEALADFKFPLPPTLIEQKAIATALSDVDALIASLDKLIQKKKSIKQGVMQELLTGKRRLEGFGEGVSYKKTEVGEIPEDWGVFLLPEAIDFIHGKAHEKDIDPFGKYKVVNSKFISTEGRVVKRSNLNFCPAKKGDVLTVLSDLPNGKALAKCFYVDQDEVYAVNQRICIWRSKGADPKFLHLIMNRNKYFLKFDDGVTQTHILNHHIHKCPIILPQDLDEQKAIAKAIFDLQAEINSLIQKRVKVRNFKQGMMQELLTGKTRLI